jgi:retron-type reverse transcriptase
LTCQTRIRRHSRNSIKIESGIKQGCPISGLLFNTAIDPIKKNIQGEGNQLKILAYADNLVILADKPEEMQRRLNEMEHLAERICIKINPTKSFSIHLSGLTPVGTRDARSIINKSAI